MALSACDNKVYNALVRWDKLTSFLDNVRVETDNNIIDNRIRPIALGRKKLSVCWLPCRCATC
ncbi:MAG: transposase [Rhodothermaceae bacterium]|nr:transposase [Rhodothermaceae bacterium]MXX58637.1 transposase [Rhodothermaceae bacterium]MYD19716.1 transposase [Rhodothermaceae bacterium]MYD57019.1 transposase [Rhodothermaceae bacterium]MYJ56021.1 transposase [Rhodothermaceae bacterium]